MKTIVIDPGHGGWDSGAVATDGKLEKEFNLELGLALRQALTRYDCRVVMTRETDTALAAPNELGAELRARAEVANRENADLLVSLHHDSAGSPQARGGSLYIWTNKRNPQGGLVWLPAVSSGSVNHTAPRSFAIAGKFYPVLRETLSVLGVPSKEAIMCADFGVLRATNGACLLIECFYGSSPEDVASARKPGFVDALAAGIARGLGEALDLALRPEPDAGDGPAWDPVKEIAATMEAGLIDSIHKPEEPVTWGQFATVLNRLVKLVKEKP